DVCSSDLDTPNAPRSLAAFVEKYVSTYNVAMMPRTTARIEPTNTAKKSSTRERPRRNRYKPWKWNPSGTSTAMNGRTFIYWPIGGMPFVIGTIGTWKRSQYAMMNADTPINASVTT